MEHTCIILAALAFSQLGLLHAAPARKPNILFIYAEDTGYYTSERAVRETHTHIAGLQTPNLDALAASSVNFTRTFCAQSVCSPRKSGI